jgi:AAA domain, putative AbiEii toxin, Type IV TA system
MSAQERPWDAGSFWHRWDPHIHAPGTILEDEFGGDWEGYLRAIETSEPRIEALGITDYYVLDSYRAVRAYKDSGRLPDVRLIFPNVELRYELGVQKGSAVNVHLLVNPEDDDHVARLERFLSELTFETSGQYRCTRPELIRLGESIDANTRGYEAAALRKGVEQFKVNRARLHELCRNDPWASKNVVLALPASSKDGSSALQGSGQKSVREDIERNATFIFSGEEKVRQFWLGLGKVPISELIRTYRGPKPCIHGSDAHYLSRVGKPDKDRYTWIKGDLTFDSLLQASMEPANRAWIGVAPPAGPLDSEIISSVRLTNAEWLQHDWIDLNPGLVTVIGARGSGKTALADILGAGAGALTDDHLSDKSFASRASKFLRDSVAELRWADGRTTFHAMKFEPFSGQFEPTVQYLSQQFVDKLCSSEGIGTKLLNEVKRVVFDAHSPETRLGASTFDDLSDTVTTRPRSARESNQALLLDTISQLVAEWQRSLDLGDLKKKRDVLDTTLRRDKSDRAKLMGSGDDTNAKRMDAVTRAIDVVQVKVQTANRTHQALLSLRDEVVNMRTTQASLLLANLHRQFTEAGLTDVEWAAFRLQYAGQVDEILTRRIDEAKTKIDALLGGDVTLARAAIPANQLNTPLIPFGAVLEEQALFNLERETFRLRTLVGIDQSNAATFRKLSDKIAKDETEMSRLLREIQASETAPLRIDALNGARGSAYAAIFDSFSEEATLLETLYDPLRTRLNAATGSLGKLTFHVKRRVNVEKWIADGEELLDLRTSGPFQGRGSLMSTVQAELLPDWESGSSSDAANAIQFFRDKYDKETREQAKVNRADRVAFAKWYGRYVSWLYSTQHIDVTYSIQYDGTDIEQLSPGTRGIVLLLLYVAIDQNDARPLIIDQPEENLDPKSVYDDLVVHFREARQRRQIIVVTHNANIVVNADADQVIVADSGKHEPDKLPQISYVSGGLESPEIRKAACDILEGGEQAFKERAKRLRIHLADSDVR